MKISGIRSNPRLKKIIGGLISAAIWLLIWQAACAVVNKELLLVSPAQTAVRIYELSHDASFWSTACLSLLRILAGYACGVLLGTMLACLTLFSRAMRSFFSPAVGVIRATPVASFIILSLVWLSRDSVPMFISFLMVLPIIWANVGEGLSQADTQLLEMARIFRLSPWSRITGIYIPCALPYFTAGCVTALGLAWKAGIAAEVLSLPSASIGKELYDSKIYLETTDLFAWTAIVIIMSMLLELTLKSLFKRLSHKFSERRDDSAD